MPEINYKQKYLELKQKYMNSVDTAFRLGYEQGQQDAQMQQMQEAQAQQAAMEQAAAQGGAPGQEGAEGGEGGEMAPAEENPDSANPAGSELDQHIQKLESMLSKSEDAEIRASIQNLVAMRKAEIQATELKKSDIAVKSIAKSLKKGVTVKTQPLRLSKQAEANMTPVAKAAVSMQEKIVTDIMKSWETEEKSAGKGILDIIKKEGLAKE